MTGRDGNGLYYGWIIAIASGFILLVTNGMVLGGLNVFDRPLLEALNGAADQPISLAQLKTRDAITLIVSGMMAPLAGAAADRYGVRPLMILGAILLSAGYFLYSTVDNLNQIYWIHVLFASSLASAGLVVNVILISRWFIKDRGLALGIALAGTSLGNGTLPPLNVALMNEIGWRGAFAWSSLLPLLLIPLVLFVIRERPVDLSRQRLPGSPAGNGSVELGGMALPEALRTRNFWILTCIAMFSFFSIIGTQAHLNLYMLERNFTQMDAGLSYTVLFYMGLIGKVLSGVIADRVGKKVVFVTTLGIMFAGAVVLLQPAASVIWAGLFLFGLGWGGLYTLLQLLAADFFGPRHLGKILGVVTVLDTLGGGLGPPVIGTIRDQTGNYGLAFMLIAVLIGLAFLLSTQFRQRPGPVDKSPGIPQ